MSNIFIFLPSLALQTLAKLKYDPRHYISLVVILSVCTAILTFSSQLNYRIFVADMPYKHANHIYQVNLRQGSIDISGIGMASKASINALEYHARYGMGTLVSQTPKLSQLQLDPINAIPIAVIRISDNYHEVFDVELIVGDKQALGTNGVVLSYALWTKSFNKNANIVNELIKIDGQFRRVVGVLDEEFLLPNTLSMQNIESSINGQYFALSIDRLASPILTQEPISQLQLETVDVFLQTTMSQEQSKVLVDYLVRKINQTMPSEEPLSFEILTLRKAISGSWYIFAPVMLVGSVFIFFIGFVAVCNLVLVKSGKELKHTTIEMILGASSKFILLKASIEYGLVCVVSLLIGIQLSQLFSTYLGQLFTQWDKTMMSPSIVTLVFVVIVLFGLTISLFMLSKRTIDPKNLSKTINASGKNSSSKINVALLKKLTGYQIFAMSTLLIMGSSSFVSATYEMLPLLKAQFERTSVIPITFKHSTGSQTEKHRIINEISQKVAQLDPANVIGHSNGDPFFLTSSYGSCSTKGEKFKYGRMYSDSQFINMVNADVVRGELQSFNDRNQIVINKRFALAYFGSIENVVGRSVNCKNVGGVVVAVVELNRIVHPLLKDLMSQKEAIAINLFDWSRNPTMLSDIPHLLVNHSNSLFLQRTEIERVFAMYSAFVDPPRIVNLSEQIDQQGKQPRLALFFSGVLTLTFLMLAAMGLWGSMNLQIQMRRSELAIYTMLGMKKWSLLLYIFNDNKAQAIKLIAASVFIAVWFSYLLGMGSGLRIEVLVSVLAVILILCVASIAPIIPLIKAKNINDLMK